MLLKTKQSKDSAHGLSRAGFAWIRFGFLLFSEHCSLWASETEQILHLSKTLGFFEEKRAYKKKKGLLSGLGKCGGIRAVRS